MTDTAMSTQNGTNNSDDFLVSIQDAEMKAAEIIEAAKVKQAKELNTYRQEIQAQQKSKIEAYRFDSKKFLETQSNKFNMECESGIKKAAKDAEKFYDEKEAAIKPLLKEALNHLMTLINI